MRRGFQAENRRASDLLRADRRTSFRPLRLTFLVFMLLVGVVTPLTAALTHYFVPVGENGKRASGSFTLQAVAHLQQSLCTIVVLLFVMSRSGEPWATWGIVRFRWWRDLGRSAESWIYGIMVALLWTFAQLALYAMVLEK